MPQKIKMEVLAQLGLTEAQKKQLETLTAKSRPDTRKFHVFMSVKDAVELAKAHANWRIELGNVTDRDADTPEVQAFIPARLK